MPRVPKFVVPLVSVFDVEPCSVLATSRLISLFAFVSRTSTLLDIAADAYVKLILPVSKGPGSAYRRRCAIEPNEMKPHYPPRGTILPAERRLLYDLHAISFL